MSNLIRIDIDRAHEMSKEDIRHFIHQLEEAMKEGGEPLEIQEKDYFSHGVYGREITIPKGALIVGKIHKYPAMNVISKGEVSVISIDGVMRFKAPHTFVSSPGAKRVIYAHEESVWTNFHGTFETDKEKIEQEFIAKNYEEVYLASSRSLDDVLSALSATAEQLTLISENTADQIPFPSDVNDVEVKESNIHGMGIFAAREIKAGELIAPARLGGKRTPAGRYANHSGTPNAKMVMGELGDVFLISVKEIASGEEVLTDYYFNFLNTRF